ncbi:hypothetical protein T08_11323 [Trichinella sp. T8]|uniref:Uncharacterized protein n=1 Tax=Trichinella murrelli TaxID=144512 RepID=A0A0V0TS97_9BILA|nr:hypothetical protein T05_747 [Trichinella murrelli]KRZ84000.1 hypothetical protein T08_11323 [Trichinella sp. T8]
MSNENIDVIDVPNESLLLNLIPLFVRLNTEDKLYRISNSKSPHFLSSPRSSFSCSTSIVKFSLQGTYVHIIICFRKNSKKNLQNYHHPHMQCLFVVDSVSEALYFKYTNYPNDHLHVGIDLAVNIALLWPSWLAVGDATAHAEQAESSATTTTITITIITTNISGCKQTYVVEIEKFDFFRRPAAFGTRTPFAWLPLDFQNFKKILLKKKQEFSNIYSFFPHSKAATE